MLAIRMQRTGRKGHAQFRVVVQDSRLSPKSGKFVALLGSYNPHTKTATLVKDKAQEFVNHGAQPSDRVARLLKSEGVKLPKWVKLEGKKKGSIRNPEKLRRNRPVDAEAPQTKTSAEPQTLVEEATIESTAAESSSAATKSKQAEQPAEQSAPEAESTDATATADEAELPAPDPQS